MRGRGIETAQFNFAQDDLDYIAGHYIHLDHEQRITASGGASYAWGHTRVSADLLMGTGLRADLTLPDGSNIPNGAHLPTYTQLNAGASHVFHLGDNGTLTARLDVINVSTRCMRFAMAPASEWARRNMDRAAECSSGSQSRFEAMHAPAAVVAAGAPSSASKKFN